jgi:benzodiazapine receptor
MNDFLETPPGRLRNGAMLIFFLALCATISVLGGLVTSSSVNTWYAGLAKPSFNPPDWVFAPVWTVLYIFIAVAGWRVWRAAGFTKARGAFSVYWLQLALNLVWSFLFFGMHLISVALIDIMALLAAILVTIVRFWPIDRIAAILFMPYAAWVGFATALNAAIFRLN